MSLSFISCATSFIAGSYPARAFDLYSRNDRSK